MASLIASRSFVSHVPARPQFTFVTSVTPAATRRTGSAHPSSPARQAAQDVSHLPHEVGTVGGLRRISKAGPSARAVYARLACPGRWPDVLVDVEGVVWVVPGLDVGEPVVAAPVGRPDPVLALVHEEVDVASPCRGRVQLLPVVLSPL